MYTLFVILIVIAAILMIGIVLIQESKRWWSVFQLCQLQPDWRCPQDH